jgi:hypothetical protein
MVVMETFQRHRRFLSSLPTRDEYQPNELLVPELLLATEGNLRMFYAPSDWLNSAAKVIIMGITPGWTQMEIACRTARNALSEGKSDDEASRLAKMQACFAGTMRTNLIGMLDSLGLPQQLGMESSADLFGKGCDLLHATSAIRYPVFMGSRNYTGSNPAPTKSPLLLGTARKLLAPEIELIPGAIIVPLGKSVEELLEFLAAEGSVQPGRWLQGFPHPSGANGHRARIFKENHRSLAKQVRTILGR